LFIYIFLLCLREDILLCPNLGTSYDLSKINKQEYGLTKKGHENAVKMVYFTFLQIRSMKAEQERTSCLSGFWLALGVMTGLEVTVSSVVDLRLVSSSFSVLHHTVLVKMIR